MSDDENINIEETPEESGKAKRRDQEQKNAHDRVANIEVEDTSIEVPKVDEKESLIHGRIMDKSQQSDSSSLHDFREGDEPGPDLYVKAFRRFAIPVLITLAVVIAVIVSFAGRRATFAKQKIARRFHL